MENSALTITTDMDLDDSMSLLSPNLPLTTIPEFPNEDEYEGQELDDINQGAESTAAIATQHMLEQKSIVITRSGADDEHTVNEQEERPWIQRHNSYTSDSDTFAPSSTATPTPGFGKSAVGGGRQNRLSINLSFLAPTSPSLSCPSFISMPSSTSSSPPSASYSSSSSAMSSPGGAASPILNPFQWTSDLRQYIMTDIGPQPSNSQVPALRSHLHLVRQRSYSKIGGTGFGGAGLGGGMHSPCSNGGMSPLSPSSSMAKGFGIALSPTVRRNSLQTQALVGQYGNGNALHVMSKNNSHSNNYGSSSFYGGAQQQQQQEVSLYQQRIASSSMTDLATTATLL